jgi:hypothetical protein
MSHAYAEQGHGSPTSTSFLAKAGSALVSIAKHVPTRGALWAVIGFVFGIIASLGSLALGLLTLGRGAELMVMGPWAIVPIAIPFLGAALFAVHGVHRGAARAALEIETKLGLVSHVVSRVLGFVEERFGDRLSNLPLADLEAGLKQATARYLGSDDAHEGAGITGYVLRRAKRSITTRIDTYLLAAYRAEATASGGGGVDMQKVRARVVHEMSTRMGELVMSPLNKQLALFVVLFFTLGIGWFHIALGILSLFTGN